MGSPPAQRMGDVACSALPVASVRAVPVSVLGRELVPVDAVGLACKGRNLVRPSKSVQARTHGLQMVGVYAVPDAAKMVELHSVRDWPDQQLVHDAVSPTRPPGADAYVAVAVGTDSPRPQPARVSELNFGDHPLKDGSSDMLSRHREFTPQGVIGPDVSASRPFSILPDSNNFWLGLAATQSRVGTLEAATEGQLDPGEIPDHTHNIDLSDFVEMFTNTIESGGVIYESEED